MLPERRSLAHPSYRADIDGLRAIAVLAVVGFHAFPSWVKGGFVGVDVFFVISGFLISSIIFSGLDKDTFNFSEFYARRIKRIFPALILVLAANLVLGWLVLLPDEYRQLGKHAAAGAGFISNFAFWQEAGYFDNSAETKPLLHLWSLGIEEQFYIVWPLLVYWGWKIKPIFLLVVIAIAAISFTLNVTFTGVKQATAFYFPTTRLWELLIGSLLAYSCVGKQTWRGVTTKAVSITALNDHGITLREFKSALGIVLICVAFFLLPSGWHFPGWWALVPTIGTYFVVSAGPDSWFNRNILSHRILVWLGLISFPFYLWHWPLLTYVRFIEPTPSLTIILVVILISIALAWLTYRFIERPVRFGVHSRKKIIVLCILMTAVGYIGYDIYKRNGLEYRIVSTHNDRNIRFWKLSGPGLEAVSDCSLYVNETASSFCATTVEPNVAIIGDSHAGHLFYGFLNSSNHFIAEAMTVGAGACQPTLGAETGPNCDKQLLAAIDIVRKSPQIKYVFLSGYYALFDRADSPQALKFFDGYLRTFKALHALGKTVVFVMDTPTLKVDPELCLGKRPIVNKFPEFFTEPKFCTNLEKSDLKDHSEYNKFVESLKKADKKVIFYNPHNAFCHGDSCKLFYENNLLYSDWNHLSIYGSKLLAKDLVSALNLDKYK